MPRCTTQGLHKRTYLNRAAAKKAARRMATVSGGPMLEAYRCDCDRWHIGKPRRNGRP